MSWLAQDHTDPYLSTLTTGEVCKVVVVVYCFQDVWSPQNTEMCDFTALSAKSMLAPCSIPHLRFASCPNWCWAFRGGDLSRSDQLKSCLYIVVNTVTPSVSYPPLRAGEINDLNNLFEMALSLLLAFFKNVCCSNFTFRHF